MLLLFVAIPASFLLPVHPGYKLALGLFGFMYVLYMSFRVEEISLKKEFTLTNNYWTQILLRFVVIAGLSFGFLYLFNSQDLFNVVKANPTVWVIFMLVYAFFSVIPQEFIYRSFFFKRYSYLFKNEYVFIGVNALIFSFAHIWFMSWVVLAFTFVGGILFALTYRKTKSLLVLSIEHAIYGNWLYTVGYGELFMFPIE